MTDPKPQDVLDDELERPAHSATQDLADKLRVGDEDQAAAPKTDLAEEKLDRLARKYWPAETSGGGRYRGDIIYNRQVGFKDGYRAGYRAAKPDAGLVEALEVIATMNSPMGFAGCPEVARRALEAYRGRG